MPDKTQELVGNIAQTCQTSNASTEQIVYALERVKTKLVNPEQSAGVESGAGKSDT